MVDPKEKKRETKTARKKKAKAEWKWAKVVFGKLDDLEKRIDKIEKWIKEHPEGKKQVFMRLEKLEKAIKLIREKLDI